MESQRSKEDEAQKISTSVFVTNFPDQFNAKDLWNTCKQYGNVVDAYIPNRRSKAGKRISAFKDGDGKQWVGQTMGYNMEGCMKNMEEIIEPQGVNEKGEVVIMGDFNEVQNKAERFGSVFNVQGANSFNLFISNAGLEEVPLDEIKRAVWDCGIDKCPGPDGFTFIFYRRYWKIIECDVVDAVTCFFRQGPISLIGSMYKIIAKILANRLMVVLGNLVNEVQSTFVVDWQILDGPSILNEILQWCKSKKKQSLIFKVDFEKAYDSVRWDYLDDILRKFGFGEKWCMFNGVTLGSSLHLSHMFYADDAIFVGQWNESNINTIVYVLDCFHRASGLHINMSKSKLMGISVDVDKVDQAAKKIGGPIIKMEDKDSIDRR
ncbi:RNA-directed DNA polymerase, eukaryota, reverse transcriptase zinc-binding domain protein [Tanacetum coccineum]